MRPGRRNSVAIARKAWRIRNQPKPMADETNTDPIKETKELVTFLAALVTVMARATKDGFQVTDLMVLIPLADDAKAAFADLDKVAAELAIVTESDTAEIVEAVSIALDLEGSKAERVVEKALEVLPSFVSLIREIQGE